MKVKILTAPILSWYRTWIGMEIRLPDHAPHTDTEWAYLQIPGSDEWMMIKKADCEIITQ